MCSVHNYDWESFHALHFCFRLIQLWETIKLTINLTRILLSFPYSLFRLLDYSLAITVSVQQQFLGTSGEKRVTLVEKISPHLPKLHVDLEGRAPQRFPSYHQPTSYSAEVLHPTVLETTKIKDCKLNVSFWGHAQFVL